MVVREGWGNVMKGEVRKVGVVGERCGSEGKVRWFSRVRRGGVLQWSEIG